ncbi:MAG TPA: hypothetical protein VE868_12300 [Balneolaceae bacterium]|nr:hypothetical protein [Balneolaceae bacterium]
MKTLLTKIMAGSKSGKGKKSGSASSSTHSAKKAVWTEGKCFPGIIAILLNNGKDAKSAGKSTASTFSKLNLLEQADKAQKGGKKKGTTKGKSSGKKIISSSLVAIELQLKKEIAKMTGKKVQLSKSKKTSDSSGQTHQHSKNKTPDVKEATIKQKSPVPVSGKANSKEKASKNSKNSDKKKGSTKTNDGLSTSLKKRLEEEKILSKSGGKKVSAKKKPTSKTKGKTASIFKKMESGNAPSKQKHSILKGDQLKKQASKLHHHTQSKQAPSPKISHAGTNKKPKLSALNSFKKQLGKTGHKTESQTIKQTVSKAGQKGSPKGQQAAASRPVHNKASADQKATANKGPLPGKAIKNQSSKKVDLKMDMNTSGKFKGKSKKSSTGGAQASQLNTSQLTEAAGRKTFSRQLAQQVSQQHFSQQTQSASRQASVWKHHRLLLNDGKTIHIASRNSNGALQLQLNAGNGQLGKILHQHLQEIQQHLQEQLNIDINLQLQDFGGQQQERQSEATSTKKSKDKSKTTEKATVVNTGNTEESRQVRYLGFNQNEWTA